MKRKSQWIVKIVEAPELFREDLEFIAHVLSEGGNAKLEIRGSTYEYDDIAEVYANADEKLTHIKISRGAPHVVVTIDRRNVDITAFSDEPFAAGLVARIHDYLTPRERLAHRVLGRTLTVLGYAAIFSAPLLIFATGDLTLWLLMAFPLLEFFYSMRGGELVMHRWYRAERKSFLQRHGDMLVANSISGAIGSILGAALTWAFTRGG